MTKKEKELVHAIHCGRMQAIDSVIEKLGRMQAMDKSDDVVSFSIRFLKELLDLNNTYRLSKIALLMEEAEHKAMHLEPAKAVTSAKDFALEHVDEVEKRWKKNVNNIII